MALEDLTGASKFIDDLVNTNPVGSTDTVSQLDDHIRGVKNVLLNSFPGVTGAVTSTHTELNALDGYTGNTADLNVMAGAAAASVVAGDIQALAGIAAAGVTPTEIGYLNGVTSAIQTQLAARLVAASNLSDLGSAATARTNLGLGTLAVQSQIDETDIDWANSDGLTQFDFGEWNGATTSYLDGGSDGTSFDTKFWKRVYIPANANSIEGQAFAQKVGGLGACEVRITIGGSSGTAGSTSSTSYTAVTLPALSVSALSGWVTVEIEYRPTVASTDCRAYVDSAALVFI